MLPIMRGSNVLVRTLQKKTQRVGNIELAGALDREIDQVLILAVGPGDVTASVRSTTFDLQPGQICAAQVRSIRKPNAANAPEQVVERAVKFVHNEETLSILSEDQIGIILRQPDAVSLAEVEAANVEKTNQLLN